MDIRNYFSVLNNKSKKEGTSESKTVSALPKQQLPKKKKRILDSDDEDPVPPQKIQIVDLSEDSDDDIFLNTTRTGEKKSDRKKSKSAKANNSKTRKMEKSPAKPLKPVTPALFFSSAAAKKSDAATERHNVQDKKRKAHDSSVEDEESPYPKAPKLESKAGCGTRSGAAGLQLSSPKSKTPIKKESLLIKEESNTHPCHESAKDLKQTCKKTNLKTQISSSNSDLSPPKPNENSPPSKSSQASASSYKIPKIKHKECSTQITDQSKMSPNKSPVKKSSKDVKLTLEADHRKKSKTKAKSYVMEVVPSSPTKSKSSNLPKQLPASPDPFLDDSVVASPDKSILVEKKKQQAKAYQKYLQRAGPRNPGSKVVPEGAPGCLANLSFVLSGVLESLDRTEVTEIVQRYGGRVVGSVSKKTTHLLIGDDAGASKMAKAEQLGTKVISEDDFLDMLRTRPGTAPAAEESPVASSAKNSTPKANKTVKLSAARKDSSSSSASPGIIAEGSPMSSQNSISSSQPLTQPLDTQDLQDRNSEELMWVDKYKPVSLKNVIGQQGDKSNARKLLHWLSNWAHNHSGGKKLAKPSPWAKDNDGSFFKAALLSGPPGVGKTTTAQLVCRELGFDAVELNASDTRSKRSLTEEVSQLLSNTSLSNFASGHGGAATSRHHVLLMDEVDGMAGNEDRGGVQELISLMKTSKVPIICMCNDRQHPKIRSLANHCFDLRFSKPRVEQIRGAMMSVCFREGVKLKPEALDQIILGSNQDVRQILHHLAVFSANNKSMDSEQTKKDANLAKKDLKFGPWDVCRQVFNESDRKNMNIHQKSDLFFYDYSIGPLFVQENYWKARPKSTQNEGRVALLQQLAKAANNIADGDLVERAIRSGNNWSLLPTQAIFSCVLPGEAMSGHLSGEIQFPAWLGNNSKKNKMDRLSQELLSHMRLKISGNKTDVALEYSRSVLGLVLRPLLTGVEGVTEAVEAMNAYGLAREDLDSVTEVAQWTGKQDLFSKIDSKVKAAFTRALNKTAVVARPTSRKKRSAQEDEAYGDDDEDHVSEDEEDDDDITTDALIKIKKPAAAASSSKKTAATSSASGKGRGKGKK